MACRRGFKIIINDTEYLVRCNWIVKSNTPNTFRMELDVFEDCDYDKPVKVGKNSYLEEKITDFIRNCINGQDTLYWNPDGTNRHLEEK